MAISSLLISLCLGYLVFLQASKEKKDLKLAGRVIGTVVMILSIVGVVCSTKCIVSKISCPLLSKGVCNKSASQAMVDCPMMLGPAGK